MKKFGSEIKKSKNTLRTKKVVLTKGFSLKPFVLRSSEFTSLIITVNLNIWMKRFGLILLTFICVSCATYYQANIEFNDRFEKGQLDAAEKALQKQKTKRTKFLYYANRGVVNSMQGEYEESNNWLEKAYVYNQEFRQNAGEVVASYLVNPTVSTYQAEDHEGLLLLYYKALNYLKMGEYESALVECRRLNNGLNELSDKYKSDNKYKRDAFIHNLMGIAYEASGDVNNAFIAYRNSYDIYKDDYKRLFNLNAPEQLKEDLLRTAYLNGFQNDLLFYEKEFDTKYTYTKTEAELVFFWHNGLGPVKGEWSINFAVQDNGGGAMTFANSEYGMSFPFIVGSSNPEQSNSLASLKVFRVAFPKYVERTPIFNGASLVTSSGSYALEMAEDINQIAFKTLQERMLKEFSKSLLRVALKKVAENQVRQENEGLGAIFGLVNAFTEKADTRNWQTIPHSIYYSRVPLDKGENVVRLQTQKNRNTATSAETFTFTPAFQGQTIFHTYQSLESLPTPGN